MRHLLPILLSFTAALGGIEGAAQSAREETLAKAILTPPFPLDRCIMIYVPPSLPKKEFIECDDRNIADVARQLARSYRLDSVCFVKPVDTSRQYLGGRFLAPDNEMYQLFEHLDTFADYCKMWPQHKTLFVWTNERPKRTLPTKKHAAKKEEPFRTRP